LPELCVAALGAWRIGCADAGTFAIATTSESASPTAGLVMCRLFEPGLRTEVRLNDFTSHSDPVTPFGFPL